MPAAGQRFAVALLAQAGRLEVGPAGEEADPAVAEAEQVLGGGDRAGQVVGVRRSAGVDGPAWGSTATIGTVSIDVDDRRRDEDRSRR